MPQMPKRQNAKKRPKPENDWKLSTAFVSSSISIPIWRNVSINHYSPHWQWYRDANEDDGDANNYDDDDDNDDDDVDDMIRTAMMMSTMLIKSNLEQLLFLKAPCLDDPQVGHLQRVDDPEWNPEQLLVFKAPQVGGWVGWMSRVNKSIGRVVRTSRLDPHSLIR